jgi:preprotein translocase subunit SecG
MSGLSNVLIVAYLLIVLAMIAVILLQRSEGGGLGMGTSSAGIMTVRGSANLLTRTTAILAALFMATAIGLTILNELDTGTGGILGPADDVGEGAGGDVTVLDRLNEISGAGEDDSLAVPESAPAASGEAPAAETTTAPAPASDPALAVPEPSSTEAPSAETPASGEAPAAPTN